MVAMNEGAGPAVSTAAEAVAGLVTGAAADALGRPPGAAVEVEELPNGFGPDSWSCRLPDAADVLWSSPLVVRIAPDAARAETEAGWMRWAADHGYPAPRVLATTPDPTGVVMLRPGLPSAVDRMGDDPAGIPQLIGQLGRLHARLHALPVDEAPGPLQEWGDALALVDAQLALAGTGPAAELAEARAWLDAADPGPVAPVPCHGEFNPVTVYVDPDDVRSAVVTSWSKACLSDRERDVAETELAFWASAYLVPDRARRTMLKMARGFMISGYAAGYRAAGRPLDERRLKLWGALLAVLWSATAAAVPVPETEVVGEWRTEDLVKQRDAFRHDLVKRFRSLSDGP
jgi:hypothetical protein